MTICNKKLMIVCSTIVAVYGLNVLGQYLTAPYKLDMARAESVREAIRVRPDLMTTPLNGMGGPEYPVRHKKIDKAGLKSVNNK